MGADVFLEVGNHLFSVLKVLDGKKAGHGEGKKTDQSKNDFKAEAIMELDLSHRIFQLFRVKRRKIRNNRPGLPTIRQVLLIYNNPIKFGSNFYSKSM
jgi:hypothetical protein